MSILPAIILAQSRGEDMSQEFEKDLLRILAEQEAAKKAAEDEAIQKQEEMEFRRRVAAEFQRAAVLKKLDEIIPSWDFTNKILKDIKAIELLQSTNKLLLNNSGNVKRVHAVLLETIFRDDPYPKYMYGTKVQDNYSFISGELLEWQYPEGIAKGLFIGFIAEFEHFNPSNIPGRFSKFGVISGDEALSENTLLKPEYIGIYDQRRANSLYDFPTWEYPTYLFRKFLQCANKPPSGLNFWEYPKIQATQDIERTKSIAENGIKYYIQQGIFARKG